MPVSRDDASFDGFDELAVIGDAPFADDGEDAFFWIDRPDIRFASGCEVVIVSESDRNRLSKTHADGLDRDKIAKAKIGRHGGWSESVRDRRDG